MDQERAWIEQALGGDQEAFGHLVRAYERPVYNLTYRMLGNSAEAEDAAQETFLRAYSKLATYQPGRKFVNWLLSIASHYCIDLSTSKGSRTAALVGRPTAATVADKRLATSRPGGKQKAGSGTCASGAGHAAARLPGSGGPSLLVRHVLSRDCGDHEYDRERNQVQATPG